MRNAEGHVIATGDDAETQNDNAAVDLSTMEEDLAKFENTDGNWDDSDDEDVADLSRNISRTTLASSTPSHDNHTDTPEPVLDAWDL